MKHQHIVHALNRQARENAAIGELEHRATPFFYMAIVMVALLAGGQLIDEYADAKHAGSIQTASAFAECLNGKPINADGAIARCEVVSYALVGGAK